MNELKVSFLLAFTSSSPRSLGSTGLPLRNCYCCLSSVTFCFCFWSLFCSCSSSCSWSCFCFCFWFWFCFGSVLFRFGGVVRFKEISLPCIYSREVGATRLKSPCSLNFNWHCVSLGMGGKRTRRMAGARADPKKECFTFVTFSGPEQISHLKYS